MEQPIANPRNNLSIPYIALLDTLPIVTYVAGPNGRLEYLSPLWDETFGSKARGFLIENDFESVVHPDDLIRVRSNWEAAVSEVKYYNDEFRMALLHNSREQTSASFVATNTVVSSRIDSCEKANQQINLPCSQLA